MFNFHKRKIGRIIWTSMQAIATAFVFATASHAATPESGPSPEKSAGFQNVQKAVRIITPVHIEGRRLIDATGKEIRLLGVNSSSLEYGFGQQWQGDPKNFDFVHWVTPEGMGVPNAYDMVSSWGFNCVRLPITWSNLEPVPPKKMSDGTIHHFWNYQYLNAVDHVVSEFGRRGVVVILSVHQWAWSPAFVDPNGGRRGLGMPQWLYHNDLTQTEGEMQFCFDKNPVLKNYTQQDAYLDYCRLLASHFHGNRNIVAFDIFNEPPHYQGFNLANCYERIARSIREIDPGLVLIFQEAHSKTPLKRKPQIANAIYSVHFYPPGWDQSKPDRPSASAILQRAVNRATVWNLPLYVGEFGAFGGSDPDGFVPDVRRMMQFCKSQHISWTYFPLEKVMAGSILRDRGVSDSRVRWPLVKVLQSGF